MAHGRWHRGQPSPALIWAGPRARSYVPIGRGWHRLPSTCFGWKAALTKHLFGLARRSYSACRQAEAGTFTFHDGRPTFTKHEFGLARGAAQLRAKRHRLASPSKHDFGLEGRLHQARIWAGTKVLLRMPVCWQRLARSPSTMEGRPAPSTNLCWHEGLRSYVPIGRGWRRLSSTRVLEGRPIHDGGVLLRIPELAEAWHAVRQSAWSRVRRGQRAGDQGQCPLDANRQRLAQCPLDAGRQS